MYRILIPLLACGLAVAGCAATRSAETDATHHGNLTPMSPHDIVMLSQAGISDSLIVTMMDASGSAFSLTTGQIIALADSGVSNSVISAMVQRKPADVVQAPARVHDYWYAWDPFWDPWYYPYWSAGFGWYYVPRYRVGPGFAFHSGFRGRHR